MKRKLFTVAFIVMFLLETILTMNVLGVDPSAIPEDKSVKLRDSIYNFVTIIQLIVPIMFFILFQTEIIRYVLTKKEDKEGRKKIIKRLFWETFIAFVIITTVSFFAPPIRNSNYIYNVKQKQEKVFINHIGKLNNEVNMI